MASLTDTSVAATYAEDVLEKATEGANETSIANTQTANVAMTAVAINETVNASNTAIAMTRQAQKQPTATPISPSSYGGLTYGCISTAYWYLNLNSKPEAGYCWDLTSWGLYAEDKSLRLNIPNTGLLEKAIFMNIPSTQNVYISFSSIVNSISGSDKEDFSRLAIGICDPNDYHNKNDFIYYTLYQPNQPTISIRVNGFSLDNISNYYYDYVNALQNLDFSLTANDLSVSVDGSKKILHQFVDRTSITAFCVYYSVPRGGQLDASIENIFIQDK